MSILFQIIAHFLRNFNSFEVDKCPLILILPVRLNYFLDVTFEVLSYEPRINKAYTATLFVFFECVIICAGFKAKLSQCFYSFSLHFCFYCIIIKPDFNSNLHLSQSSISLPFAISSAAVKNPTTPPIIMKTRFIILFYHRLSAVRDCHICCQ